MRVPEPYTGAQRLAIAALSALLLIFAGAASGFAAELSLSDKVIAAMGGRERLMAAEAIRITSHSINFGNMTSYAVGAPPIHLSDGEDETLWQPATERYRIHARLSALVPFPGGFDFEEAYDGTFTTRAGPKDYRPGTDPGLPGAYLGARLKRLWLDNPQWLIALHNPITASGGLIKNGKHYLNLVVELHRSRFTVLIDPDTFLPVSLVTHEFDGFSGAVVRTDIKYSDWREVDGIMMPFRIEQLILGALTRRVIRTDAAIITNVPDAEYRLTDVSGLVPPERSEKYLSADGSTNMYLSDVQWGRDMSNWFLGRYAMGRGSETRQMAPVDFREIGEGIFHVTGSTHHNLVIVGPNSLAVIDAPFYPRRSKEVLLALRKRWPEKPVQYLILTHHHADHMGGMSEYTKGGAQLVVAAGNKATFQRNFDGNGLLGRGDQRREILEVSDRRMLPDFGRQVELLWVPNSHAFHMLVAYFPEEKLLFATDIYSPGRPKQPPNFPGELLNAIEFYDLDVERLIGGHGGGPDSFARFLEFAE